MGSFVSTAKFFQLPFRNSKNAFDSTVSDDEMINTLANANLSRIQTIREPTSDEIRILNEIFKTNPKIKIKNKLFFITFSKKF